MHVTRQDAKIVLLGGNYVGKTSLLQRYVRGIFNENFGATIGAAFGSKKEIINGKPIMLGIWINRDRIIHPLTDINTEDTAGHERYESMTRMYYRGAAACILCYDITDRTSFDRVRFWAGELKSTEQNCKIYLCGTKKDIVEDSPSKRDVDVGTAQPLAADLQAEWYETSSKTGENIEKSVVAMTTGEFWMPDSIYIDILSRTMNVDRLFKQIAKDILQKAEAEKLKHANEQREDGVVHIDQPRGWRSTCAQLKC